MPAIVLQTIVWTLNSHVCAVSCTSRHVAVVKVVFIGHSPQLAEDILYDIAERSAATLLQLKISPPEVILVRRTLLGGGSGSSL